VRTYLLLAAAEFRRYSTYRLAILAGITTQSVFGFIRISVLSTAISSAGGTLAGYNQQLASTYVWLGQALLAAVALFGWIEIADRVSSGEIAVDFARPVDLQLAWWARDLGRASSSCCPVDCHRCSSARRRLASPGQAPGAPIHWVS